MAIKLPREFYVAADVTVIARNLLGKILVTEFKGLRTSGVIVETEAYRSDDRACHAFQKRKTKRNAVMFEEGGVAYVFMNYGIHFLFNVVVNRKDEPDAVLIRALEPFEGVDVMMMRRKKTTETRITSGPGSLTMALGIDLRHNGEDLTGNKIWIEENDSVYFRKFKIASSRRIGIDYAGEHALLPWRYFYRNNPWISKP